MRKQAGFMLYAAICALLVIGALSLLLQAAHADLRAEKASHKALIDQTKAIGEIQIAKNAANKAKDDALKEKLDNENKDLHAKLAVAGKRLRDAINSRGGGLSSIPVATVRPDLACFDRAELDTAIRLYQSDLLGIAEKGATATLNLDTGISWVREHITPIKP